MKNIILIFSLLIFGFVQAQDPINFIPANNNTTINTCNGFIIDSGGQGGAGYGNGENVTITICPDTIASGNNEDFINIVFNLFDLDVTDLDPAQNSSDQDVMYVYDGVDVNANFLGSYTGNGLAGTTIQATNLNPSGCITLQFVSNGANAAGNWMFTASATCATPCDSPVSLGQIVGGPAADSIAVCINEVVTFQDLSSFAQPGYNLVAYEWNFMDGSTAVGSANGTVTHSYANPGEYTVNLFVTDDNADEVCQNANLTSLRVYVAPVPTFYEFPGDTTLCIGEQIDLVAQPAIFDSTWAGFPGTVAIDDGCMYDTLLGVAQVVDLMQTGFNVSTITDISQITSICLDMEHSYMGDLVIQVQCPDGTIVTLHQQGGGGTQIGIPDQSDNVDCLNGTGQGVPFTYCFTPQATDTWVEWVANNGGGTLPAGDYEPVQALDGLIGCPLNGVWNLIVTDNWGADDGTVFGWGINFDPILYPDITIFTPQIGDAADSSSWDMADPFITNLTADGNIATITPTVDGVYQYTYSVTDHFGCSNDSTINITVDPQIFIGAGLDTAVCNGEVVVIGDNGGGAGVSCDYVLDLVDTFGDGWNGNTIDITIAGVTTSYAPGGNGQTITIPVNHGDQIDIQWFASGSWQSECEIYLYDGDGNLMYSDGLNGSVPSANLNSVTADCFGGMQFVWTPNDGSLDNVNIPNPTVINPMNTTTYTLTVFPTGHPQCATSDDVVVSIGGGLDAGGDSTIILCHEGTPEDLYIYLSGNPQLGGTWFNPAGQEIVMPIQPDTIADGVYEYFRDSAGCFVSAFITVSVNQLSVSAIIDHSDCNAFNGEVQLIQVNGMGPVQYSNDAGVTYQAGDTFVGGMGSDNSYNFVILDSVGCIASLDTIVIDDNFPLIDPNSIVLTDSDCSLDNGEVVSVTTNGGTANYTYSIDGVNFQTLAISNISPNTYDLIVNDNFGCADTVEIIINEINTPVITDVTPTDITCYTANDGTIEITGTNLQSYSIDNGVSFSNSGTFTGLAPGVYDIIGASGPNGTLCTDTWIDQITLIEPTPLQIDTLSTDIVVCVGDEVLLGVLGSGGNGNYTYDWDYLGNNLGQGSSVSFEVDLSIQVCVTMSEDCPSPTVTQCMNITTSPNVYPKLESADREGCYPLEATFINITNDPSILSSTWTFSDNGSSVTQAGNVSYVFQDAGIFDINLSVVSVDGCVFDTTYSQYITVHDHPEANYSYTPIPMTVYDTEAQFVDYSSGMPVAWQWHFGSGAIPLTSTEQNPTADYPEGVAAIYETSLHVYNEFGCVDSMFSQVQVINDVLIFAPNVFTPDGDEYNETWRVYISGVDVYDFHCTIFNRWGEIVWESYNVDGEWDGTYAGANDVQDGTYVWVVYANDSYDDRKYEFRGTVNILR